MRIRNTKLRGKHAVILAGVAILAYFLWTTSTLVIAFQEVKHARVAPTAAGATGWSQPQQALAADLPSDAPFASFNISNSAWIELAGGIIPDPNPPAPVPEQPAAPASIPTSIPPVEVIPPPQEEIPPPPAEAAPQEDAPPQESSAPVVEEDVPPQEPQSPPQEGGNTQEPALPQDENVLEPPAEPGAESAPVQSLIDRLKSAALLSFADVAYAATTTESEGGLIDIGPSPASTSDVPDVTTCFVLRVECHTLELTGFGVDGSLTDKKFKSAQLHFSFAASVPETHLPDSKLQVRYYHAGAWKTAGEIYINKEISNLTNGGYFSSELEGIAAWEDLADVRVVIEFIRGDERVPAQVFLDSVWLDASYTERAQDLLSGEANETPEDMPENVSLETPQEKRAEPTLITEDGDTILFPFTNNTEEPLTIRVDRPSYMARPDAAGARGVVYASVTNNTGSDETFRIVGAFEQGQGAIAEISQYFRNVATTTRQPILNDVAYLCESGWQSAASSSVSYSCADTDETRECSWVSAAGTNCLVKDVQVDVEEQVSYTSSWVPAALDSLQLPEDEEVVVPAGFRVESHTQQAFKVPAGHTIYFKIVLSSKRPGPLQFVLAAQGSGYTAVLDSVKLAESQGIKDRSPKARAPVNERISTRSEFDGDELPEFRFKFRSQRSALVRALRSLVGRSNTEFTFKEAKVQSPDGNDAIVPVDVEYEKNGEWKLAFKKRPHALRPGKYRIELSVVEGNAVYSDSYEFVWGVLAVNTNKTIYRDGEQVSLQIATLDDTGSTICDAKLELILTAPNGSSETVPTERSGKCGPNNVIDVPDYSAQYTTRGEGTYRVSLTHLSESGAVLHHVEDSFQVRSDLRFEIERVGPTRIYPMAPYTMELRVKALDDFDGTLKETLPLGFQFPDKAGATLSQWGDALHLTWKLSMKAGQEQRIVYTFDAPDVSPYLYIAGPATLTEGATLRFQESRTWKIASDALGNYVEKNSSWSPTVANAWEAKDLSGSPFNVPANATLEIAVVNSDPNNEHAGGVRHASSSLQRTFLIHEPEPQGTTEFVMHVQASATSSIQTLASSTAFISFKLLGYWTNGYYVERINQIDPNVADNTWGGTNLSGFGVASGTVAEMIVGNWNAANNPRNAGVRSSTTLSRLANIHESEAGGVNGATMLVKATSSSATIQVFGQVEGGNFADVDYWLMGFWSINPTGLDYYERFDNLGGPASGSTWTDVALSTYSVPATGIAQILFADNAAANLSQLLGVRTDGSSIDRSFNIHEAEAGGWSVGGAHVKAGADSSATIEYYTDDTTSDEFRLLGYWAAANYPPNAPTLYDIPFESEKTGSSTPSIRFSAVDPDGTSDIVYQIQWDDDSVLDDSPIGDRVSSNESGCSPNCFQNLTSPGDTNPFTEGNVIEFTIQTPLVSGTTYYWRVRANDVSGSGIDSEWSTTTSFTYVANTNPKQWFQTEDAQFDTGTLSGTETSGSHSVQLVTSDPTGAMIAYGEGVVQTPRYRLWDGSAWGSELSAQDVGGVIQWIRLKAGTTRDEYVLGTQDASGDVNFQIYNGGSTSWGNLQEATTTVLDLTARAFDVAYETQSGDAIAVVCASGPDAQYWVWNGLTWSGPSALNLASANTCEWVQLASDPSSDEIILVVRDTTAGATDYEALVWDGSTWGNSTTLGTKADAVSFGAAVEYEESGDQALVAVSNGAGNSFLWISWNGANWSTPVATQSLGNDFLWGKFARDDGSDSMALCYADLSDDGGLALWDGTAFATFVEATHEFDLGLNVGAGGNVDGRAFSCEYETTAGRDGYIMVPYSDTANGRYRVWTGAAYGATEANISTVQDSWTVGSVRTGAGKILSYFHDDVNARYDFSFWDAASWSTLQTLENSPSVTAAPFDEPIGMAAQIYQSSSGTIVSDPVYFTQVPNRSTWGEVLWNTTEPTGTDVLTRVYYSTSTASCPSYGIVPDSAIPGNAAGFSAASSPVDISSLSTTTYPRLCLHATLSSTNTSVPTLNDWTIAWTRQPYLTQESYHWYVNTNASLPTDAWPTGGTDLSENEAIPEAYAPYPGQVLRLRMSVLDSNVAQSTASLSLRLQYAAGQSCSASMSWHDVGATGSTTAAWRGYDNAGVSDGATLGSLLITTADVAETYEEQNDSSLNPNAISVGQEGEWDWVLEHNASNDTTYCFRVVTSENQTLNAYDRYPSLLTNSKPNAPTQDKLFDNEKVASTTPHFEFAAQDPEANEITYEIQVDDNYDFSSVVLDRDSLNHDTEFENTANDSDKDPFTSEQTIRFIPTTALTNGTTYYWRVRGKDRQASGVWSDWSTIRSFTIDTSVTVSTWFQTMYDQFAFDDFDLTEATSTDDTIVLTPPNTTGTSTSPTIDFDWHTSGNAWGLVGWNAATSTGSILLHVEYWTGSLWQLVPDADLSGNQSGFPTSTVSIAGLDTSTYNQIRVRANFTQVSATPRLRDWTVRWGTGISQATSTALFDNEKTGTSTPTFKFSTIDPQADDLVYEISWSTSPLFTSSTTFNSAASSSAFFNLSNPTDTSPFSSGNRIQFTVPTTSKLTNGTTYWWRVRARDPNGSNINAVWSALKSFTYDSAVSVSTWFQTTDDQFETDTLSDTEVSGSNSARVSTVSREALTAYAESTSQTPKFRVWNGTAWSAETSGVSVGDTIRFVEAAAAPTRDEYVVVTEGATGRIYAQVYNGTTETAGNMLMMGTSSNALRRGFDVAYETTSGDAVVVTCDGSEASYHIWNGSTWTATSTITLSTSGNCEWVQLASDPTSDEIIGVFRDSTTGAVDYQALVWPGSAPWGNSTTTVASQSNAADEGMAIEYEESGGQAIVALSDGAANQFRWASWNGASWNSGGVVAIGNDFAGGRIARDAGSDKLALCYIDIDNDLGLVEWSGSAWGVTNEFEGSANNFNGRPVACQYETLGARDGNVMITYSDDTAARYQVWNGSVFSTTEQDLTTIGDSWEVRSTRTGDGNVLAMAYDDPNTEYDFTYWDGSAWSTEEVLESSSIPTLTPATIPFDIVSRRFQTITSGTITSSSVVFTDGLGPKWGSVSWADTTPGSSDIIYRVQYLTSTSSWALVPDNAGFGGGYLNSVGTTTSPIDITNVNFSTYGTLRLVGSLSCAGADCPTLNDWTVAWSEGVHATGTAKQFDQSTNLTSGSVFIAVNGVLQTGKSSAIVNGTWDIPNVTAFAGDTITVFIDGAGDLNEAVAVTKYDGVGDITGMKLIERHLSIGSDDAPTVTNADLSSYDNSVSGDEDIFFNVDAGNDILVCAVAPCFDSKFLVAFGSTYRPDVSGSGNLTGRHLQIDGTMVGDGNTFTLTGSWDNNGTWTASTSTVVFSATSTTESIDSNGATTTAFYNVTFGSGASTARWNLLAPLFASSTLSINNGTLASGATSTINLGGDLSIGASGNYLKNSTTTFMGIGSSAWSDASASKQDMGRVVVDGSGKTVTLGSGVKATDITIGANDTLSAGANALEVQGNWTNNNTFSPGTGTVTFSATTTGKVIANATSTFYNITFNGGGGNWAFSGPATSSNDFTITRGTVTLPSGTLYVGGSFSNAGATGGVVQHNNGTLVLNATSGGKTIQVSTSTLYNLTLNGSGGAWAFTDTNATSSNNVSILAGTLTAPAGVLYIGGSYANTASFSHNNGTVNFSALTTGKTVAPGSSSFYHLVFSGIGGAWSFTDQNATTTRNISFLGGTTTLPSGILAVGGSFVNASTTGVSFSHNTGTVKFNATTTGFVVSAATSSFYNLLFDSSAGGWTITSSATSSRDTTIANAATLILSGGRTLEVDGTFTNSAGSATTWTNTVLYLNASSTYSINTRTSAGDTYGTLLTGSTTKVSVWNSSAATITTSGSYSYVYSQDHAGTDGDLYIWGAYSKSSGSDYWSAATDFDGTALGAAARRVSVKVATSASLTYYGTATLNIVGTSTATTTIANQGSGAYSWNMNNGTLNAQYYFIASTTLPGLTIAGTTTVTSLSNGEFQLAASGTMMTVASSAIDANPGLEIQQVRFATTTGVTGGFNVAESGNSTSYWWFRNAYGNRYGENFDNDPDGNPGDIRWDDSSFSISISGTVYSGHGTGASCLGAATVTAVVNFGSKVTGACSGGSYTINNVQFVGDPVITVFLDTNGGSRAVNVTRTVTGDLTGVDLYQNALIVRHEGVSPMAISNLVYDNGDDSDLPFVAATTSTASLTVLPDNELYIWTGKSFAPGGDVTLQSGGSGDIRDGRFYMATSSTYTNAGTQSLSIGGGFFLDSGATFSIANATTTFTATTTNKIIQSTSTVTFYNVVFNGSGGSWNLTSSATTNMNTLAMSAGTLQGTGSVVVATSSITGAGVIAMTGGEFRKDGQGLFGGSSAWTFNNLTFGNGSTAASTTRIASATTTVSGVLTVAANFTLNAGSSTIALTGAGTPFVVSGTFNAVSAPVVYSGAGATTIRSLTYAALTLAPSGGSPTYTFGAGNLSATNLTIGVGVNPVTATAASQDPTITTSGDLSIGSGATFIAADLGGITTDIGGSWTNNGSFTHSQGSVRFLASATGNTISAGSSRFYDLVFNSATGGWTISGNATSSHDTSITNASSFTLSSGSTLEVDGTFTNAAGSATTWTGSTLYLNASSTYAINTKTAAAEVYGTLMVGSTTKISMWNSSAASVITGQNGFVYSQDNGAVDGSLYIYGAYVRQSGSDYWSHATDFDGTDISGSPRQVNVRVATGSSVTYNDGLLDIIGTASASTSIQATHNTPYAFTFGGGTINADYYVIRNTDANGLNFTGATSTTVTALSHGDFELSTNGGTTITVDGSVITNNPLKIFQYNRFSTSTGITSGSNVRSVGSTGSYWKFNLHYGNYAGEAYDNDTGDPGNIRWDDSNATITISGNVYSDETASSASSVCNGSAQVVRLKVQGLGSYTSSCGSTTTGAYSINGVSYNPGDTLTLYLDGATQRAVNVSIDPSGSISDMNLYDNRVVVRHEDVSPLTIADMTQYDSDQDSDIPFNATDAATDTLVVQPATKLLVWTGKTFAPTGDVTLQSGGLPASAAYDGSLGVQASATFFAAGEQSHSIGGNLTLANSANLVAASSTFTFTATTTGKTITTASTTFYNVTFNGSGGNWAFAGPATSTNDFTITRGTVTFPTGTLYVGNSFSNAGLTGGVFQHNNGTLVMYATQSGKTIQVSTSTLYNLTLNGSGGAWAFTDTNATSSNNVSILAGTLTAPAGTFYIGGNYANTGTFAHNNGTVSFSSVTTGKTLAPGSSSFYHLIFSGAGGTWSFTDTNATTTRNISFLGGTTTLPSGILAVGGSFVNASTTGVSFSHNSGTVKFNATTTGFSIAVASSTFYDLLFDSSGGGWTIGNNATSSRHTTITNAASLTITPGRTLEVDGTFTNSVGSATTWTGSTLYLNSGTNYTINTKTDTVETYETIQLGASTDVRMWNSSAVTVLSGSGASLYSQDHADIPGSLYIYGAYERQSGTDYWSYATDFDGTALGGSSRQVNVRVATSASLSLSGGTLNIVGGAAATTTIQATYNSAFAFSISGGSINANYYQLRNLNSSGLNLTGTPTIVSLSYGDFELSQTGDTMMTVDGSVIDANASITIQGVRFATSSGVTSGFNVTHTGTQLNPWYFAGHYGNRAGESYDTGDGSAVCGVIRWDDSNCQLVEQVHFRWRNDDGGEGVPTSDWYSTSWSKRKKLAVSNPNATSYTNLPVKMDVLYDADMQSDFDDLRFTDSSNNPLDYWIESSVASASSTVWVEVPSLPSSGSATIYMYYGNGSATSLSSGTTTFAFFDDFEDDNITEYSGSDASLFDTTTSFNHNYSFGLNASLGNEGARTTNGGIYRTATLVQQGQTIQYYQYVDAGTGDEPCTLFAVQAASQNYAVCLDQAPNDKVKIVRNVTSDDDSGTTLASSTVTWVDGWYRVKIDWLTSNAINVTVYTDLGTTFATVNTTDSNYTQGGVGFTFWGQNGGWDFYSSKQYTASAPTYIFGIEQTHSGATWKAAEDATWTTSSQSAIGNIVRLRFNVQNTANTVSGRLFRLQVAPRGASLNCESVAYGDYTDVPTWTPANSCGTAVACMATSTNFANTDPTTPLLSYPANMSFSAGMMVEDPSNNTASTTIVNTAASEMEYAFKLTSHISATSYCFRIFNADSDTDLDGYTNVAQVDINYGPTISNFSLNNAQDISLTEGTSTIIYATSTVTDQNGYADMVSATSSIYRSAIGADCANDPNNCYPVASTSCSFSNCAGNSCTLSCRANIQYFAEPTDSGAFSAQNWLSRISVVDSTGLRDTQTSFGVELLTLYGLAITTGPIDFGSLNVGSNSGTTNATTTFDNTGNAPIDIELSGTDLNGSSDTIPVGEQKYATTTFVYGSCSICQFLTGSATNVDVNLPKPTSTSTPVSSDIYWGINVPSGTAAESFTGSNTFTAVGSGG